MAEKSEENAGMSFEEALARLEKLLAELESGKLPLSELTAKFEEGNRLAAFCRGKLAALEKKIEVLAKDDGGAGEWSEFNPAAAGTTGAPASRSELL